MKAKNYKYLSKDEFKADVFLLYQNSVGTST
jgi:hypothetical protein